MIQQNIIIRNTLRYIMSSNSTNAAITNDVVSFLWNNGSLHRRHHRSHSFSSHIASSAASSNSPTLFHSHNDDEQKHWKNIREKGVKIVEVGPRDGLQNESTFVSTQDKLSFIQYLIQARISCIEVASFVSPKWIPAMADSAQIVHGIQSWRTRNNHPVDDGNHSILAIDKDRNHTHVKFMALVPNLHGLQKALDAGGVDQIAVFTSASEAFSQRNIHCRYDIGHIHLYALYLFT